MIFLFDRRGAIPETSPQPKRLGAGTQFPIGSLGRASVGKTGSVTDYGKKRGKVGGFSNEISGLLVGGRFAIHSYREKADVR